MKKRALQLYEARARVAKALAHPSRLMILDAISEQEKCVFDLTQLVAADQSTVSKHLAILRDVGLVEVRKEGSTSYYKVKCKCLRGFFDCMESVLKQNLREQQLVVSSQK